MLKPPFDMDDPYRSPLGFYNILIRLFDIRSAKKAKGVQEWIKTAIAEKYERDYSEPLRWTRIYWGTYKCPKCKVTQDEGDLTSYCPHCGQKLNPPEDTNVS